MPVGLKSGSCTLHGMSKAPYKGHVSYSGPQIRLGANLPYIAFLSCTNIFFTAMSHSVSFLKRTFYDLRLNYGIYFLGCFTLASGCCMFEGVVGPTLYTIVN